ncbi:MAG: hypothetical protein ACC682_14235 [Gemmatimonadota bacterium]
MHDRELVFADSVPLGGPIAVVPSGESTLLIADRSWESILMVDRSGRLLRKVGRAGDGPGEFRMIWRIGASEGRFWVVDVRTSRISVFDEGGDFEHTFRGDGDAVGIDGFTPLSLRAGVGLTGVTMKPDPQLGVWWVPLAGTDWGVAVEMTRITSVDRILKVDIPPDGAVNMRWPFSSSDMVVTAPDGGRTVIIRRPRPGSPNSGWIEVTTFEGGVRGDSTSLQYLPETFRRSDLEAWLRDLRAPRELAAAGAYPSEEAAREAFQSAAVAPDYHPPIVNAGRGIEEQGVLIDSDGRLWLRRDRAEPASTWWLLDDSLRNKQTVLVPSDVRILAATGELVWGVTYDDLDLPTISQYRMTDAGGQ